MVLPGGHGHLLLVSAWLLPFAQLNLASAVVGCRCRLWTGYSRRPLRGFRRALALSCTSLGRGLREWGVRAAAVRWL